LPLALASGTLNIKKKALAEFKVILAKAGEFILFINH
jgi:hypothetical protein